MECWDLCNQYGLDILTTAGYIAWVMELYQRELIDDSVTGMPLRWGDHDAMTHLIHQMGRREGFGGLLSDGWQKANLKFFGKNAKQYEHYIPTIKGMTVDQDTRGTKAMALGARAPTSVAAAGGNTSSYGSLYSGHGYDAIFETSGAPAAFVQAISQRGRGRLIDDAKHIETGDSAGILGRLALGVVEVGGHGDDSAGHGFAQVGFRSLLACQVLS
jgi:aldehyde:ferredoxin oxidoreductase